MRSRTSSFVPSRVARPGRQVVLRMLNKDHDRVLRMQRRGDKSITFSSSVEIVPVTLDDDPPSWRETPCLVSSNRLLSFVPQKNIFAT